MTPESTKRHPNRTGSTRFVRRPGIEIFPLEDEAVVYDIARDTVHYMNRTARIVWEQCDGMHTASEIRSTVQNRFTQHGIPSNKETATISDGIDEALDMLCCDGLITTTEAS